MEKPAKKAKHIIVRGLLMIATLCLVLLIMLQVTLLVCINALNTGRAHDYIQAQVTTAMAGSGYNATFDKLYYDPVRGFTLHNLTVLDTDGIIATADKFSVDIAFSKIPLRELNITASGGTIHLLRLPEAQSKENTALQSTALQPFELPDIYFKTFKIFRMNIASLNIGKHIAGQDLSFSPSLQAKIKMGDELGIDASLYPKPATQFGGVALPEKIDVAGEFTPSTLAFAFNKFSVVSADYKISGKGSGQLTENGKMTIDVIADYPDLEKLTEGQLKSAKLSFVMGGIYSQPTFQMDGTIVTATLKDKGLSDITIAANANDVSRGNVYIKTFFRDEPISLDVSLSYGADILTLQTIRGTAPLVTLDGAGAISMQNSIFDGKISITASDLSYYNEILSADIAGALKMDAVLKAAGQAQALDVIASATQLRFEGATLGKADIEAHFADVSHLWPHAANLQLSDLSISDGISVNRAEAVIKDAGNDAYDLSVAGKGMIPSPVAFKGNVNLSNLTGDFPTFRNIDVSTTFGKSIISLAGALDRNVVDLKLSTKNFRGADMPVELGEEFVNIRVSGDITLSGTPATPVTNAHMMIGGMDRGAYKNLAVMLDASHQQGKAVASLSGKGAGIKTLSGKADFPLNFALFPFAFEIDMNAPLLGDVVADIDVGTLSPLFLSPTQKFSAGLKVNVDLGGTIGAPDTKGRLMLQNGQFSDDQNGIILRALTIDSTFTKDSLMINALSATDGEAGKMSGGGHLGFADGGSTDLTLSMKKFHIPSSNLADGMLDAKLSMAGNDAGYIVKGDIDIERMNIIIPETFQSKIPELNIVERQTSAASSAVSKSVSLSVKVNAPNQIFVRGWGLDAEFGGELDITGDVMSPMFDGNLASKRGRYEEFGKRFTLARANLRFQGEMPPSPYLDIEATTPADDVTASILLEGPVKAPAITFSSIPVLPQDEVLSRLLFGRDTAKITPFQAVQLAQALRRFSGEGGGGGLNPLEMLRSATGLDDISIDTDAKGETNVGVGKYLTDKVYLEFEKGKAQGSGAANIQIELTPNINLQSEIGQDAQAGGGVFWKKDY